MKPDKLEDAMSRNAKIIIGVVGALVLVCVLGAIATFAIVGSLGFAVARTVETNPAQVSVAANHIADFDLPSGYQPEASIDFGGYVFVSYAPRDGHSHIMFVQAPASANLDQAALEQYVQQAAQTRGYNRQTRTQVVGQRQATICGQAVTLVVQEGTNSDGAANRSLSGVFRGKGGPTLVSVESPISRWNQEEVDAFLASIR
jgi:hypothetical protein